MDRIKECEKLNTREKDKAYIQKIQSEIDSLEKQLFSENKEKPIRKKKSGLKFNKDLSVPMETTISNVNDETLLTQQTILNNNLTPNEKAELYKIIMRERKENNELEKMRICQNEKYKESENKCKLLEQDNLQLRNDMEELQKQRELQELKILQLQKEIDELRQIREKKIKYKNQQLNQQMNEY